MLPVAQDTDECSFGGKKCLDLFIHVRVVHAFFWMYYYAVDLFILRLFLIVNSKNDLNIQTFENISQNNMEYFGYFSIFWTHQATRNCALKVAQKFHI